MERGGNGRGGGASTSGRLCAMWARGHCNRGGRCADRHHLNSPDEKIPCDCPEKHDAFPGEPRHSHCEVNGSHAGSLLGSARNFCAAFYHCKETPEAKITESCLRCNEDGTPSEHAGGAARCSGKSVVALARVFRIKDGAPAEIYAARYKNCSSGALCAESSLIEDLSLRRALEQEGGPDTHLRVYLNASPCHFSTDTRPTWSCTEGLIRFQQEFLRPRSMQLEIVCSYPYRCHWDKHSVPARLAPKIESARQGIAAARAAGPGLVLRAFAEQDWIDLAGFTDPEIRDDYVRGGGQEGSELFSATRRAARGAMDAFCAACFGEVS